jgi:RsbT co-antagonist protein rsbRD N-terminal domain
MSLVSHAFRDAGDAILAHVDDIAGSWREAVRADASLEGGARLPDLLLTNQVPAILADIAEALKEGEDGTAPDRSIARRRRGLRFGKLRGLAHYDAADLYREFLHLRHAIWRFLRQALEWQRGDAFEVMLAIDQYLDEVIGASLRGYVEAAERTSDRATPPSDPAQM